MSFIQRNNPFLGLFNSVEDANAYASTQQNEPGSSTAGPSNTVKEMAEKSLKMSEVIEEVFLFTLDQAPLIGRPSRCVFLAELKESLKGQDWLDLNCLEQALFERLMLSSPGDHVITTSGRLADPRAAALAGESNVLRYLYQCYVRLGNLKAPAENKDDFTYERCKTVIIMNGKTCFLHQEIFTNLNTAKEFIHIFMEEYSNRDSQHMEKFFEDIFQAIDTENLEDSDTPLYAGSTLRQALAPLYDILQQRIQTEVKLGHSLAHVYCDVIMFFSKSKCASQALIQHMTPKVADNGKAYERTLLGSLLSLSCVPHRALGPYEFFDKPATTPKQELDRVESVVQQAVLGMNDKVYQIMYNMLKLGGDVKDQLLQWIGDLLHANLGRAKLWTRQMAGVMDLSNTYCSDGFFINLCAVMLRLCKPFSDPKSPKLLKVQPTYCLATGGSTEQVKGRHIHMKDISQETSLVPPPEAENEAAVPDNTYNFISECFHMTHFSLHLGFHVAHERIVKLNQELYRIQNAFRNMVNQGLENSEPGQRLKDNMEIGMTMFLSLKAALSEPKLLEYAFRFNSASAAYLNQLSTVGRVKQFEPVTFPLPDTATNVLYCIPEFVAENIVDYMLFTRRFKDTMYEMMGEHLESFLTFILVFMGSPCRMRNPHLRAHLAEGLEALMPPRDHSSSIIRSSVFRENLFKTHPHIEQLAPTLLNVFVSIEMTGQGVEFEQKFNYRQPMYAILEYLWKKPLHKKVIKRLSNDALQHMEDLNAPLFLRFINLLINDAIFLLDEALSYMSQIKEKQKEQDTGVWNRMGTRQRQEAETNLRQVEMLARFHNIMGHKTISSLEMLTHEIKDIFTHDVMVDRIAAMLNYFLLHLVGPKQRDLKVRDADKFEFKPHELMSNICQLYINLGEDGKFCLAISKDGRSYSHELFVKAENILQKIHKPGHMISKIHEIGDKVKEWSVQQQIEDDAEKDAPEEFLDTLLNTLMKDPVLLPTSGNIVDRSTIARHILSDQFDPFNRAPLTMDMVVPQTELRDRIRRWLEEKKQQNRSSSHTSTH